MLMIRLQRVGRKHDPAFRLVAVDSRRGPKSGKFLEILGSFNPRRDRPQLKADRIKHWLAQGARTSDTVRDLLVRQKLVNKDKLTKTQLSV